MDNMDVALKKSVLYPIICVSLFFLSFLIIGLMIYDDYGISWDEPFQREIGLLNYKHAFENNQELLTAGEYLKYHGAAFETFLIYIEKHFNVDNSREIYLSRHLATFLLFYISSVFFFFLCTSSFRSWKIGLLGSVFLILSPRIFAHAFYNSKDLALLSMFIISVFTLTKYLEKKTIFRAAMHALASAILIDVRVVGVFIVFLTFLFVVLDAILIKLTPKEHIKKILSISIYVLLLAPLTILFWPVLWKDPINQFIRALQLMTHFITDGNVLYFGNYVAASKLPWHYLPVWIAISTPLIYVFYFLVGAVASIGTLVTKPLVAYRENRQMAIFLIWFFAPLLAVIVLKPVIYDEWRHFFFIYPAFLLISLKGFETLFNLGKRKLQKDHRKIIRISVIVLTVLGLLEASFFMIYYHPHQNVYFNRLAGENMNVAKNNFELDYWGLSYRQGLEYLLKHAPEENIVLNAENQPGNVNSDIVNPVEGKSLQYVPLENATYFISNYRFHKDGYPYANEFYSIKVKGTKIMVIYKLK